jgi:RNA polymerase sigma-70 factor, ECF subfamily
MSTALNDASIATAAPSRTTAEHDLIRRLRAGDGQAYEELVRAYGGRMLTVARRFLPCPDDAADAVQNAFLSAFQALGSFAGGSTLGTWLHRVTINACLMLLRSRRRRHDPLVSTAAGEDLLPRFDARGHHARPVSKWYDAYTTAVESETRQQVRACIDRLPDAYRTILLLRDIEQHDTEETARLLDTTTANVKTRLHRARQMLRTELEPLFAREA